MIRLDLPIHYAHDVARTSGRVNLVGQCWVELICHWPAHDVQLQDIFLCSLPRRQLCLAGEAFQTLLPDLHPASIHPRTGHGGAMAASVTSLRQLLESLPGSPGKFTVNLR